MPGLNTKSYYNGIVDNNDLAYVIERFGNPKRILSAPISRFKVGEHKGRPKINPHVSSFTMKDGRIVSVFHVKPVYYLCVNGEWRPLSEVTTYHGNRKLILNNKWEQIEPWYLRWLMKRCELIGGQVLIPWRFNNVPVREGQEIFFTTLTKYPDPDPETNTVDGRVSHVYGLGAGVDWATIRAAAGTEAADNNVSETLNILADNVTDKWRQTKRLIFLFDTSSLTSDATISATVLSLYGISQADGLSVTPDIDIYTSTPNLNTSLAAGDYAQIAATSQTGAPITYASWSITGYNDFTFNATGRGNVSKTSISKFGARNANYDVANLAPTWASNGTSSLGCSLADETGTTQDPKLVVTYTVASTAVMSYFMGSGFWGA